MANLLSMRKIVKIPSSKLSEPKSKRMLRVSIQDLMANNEIVSVASSHMTRVLDIYTQNGFNEQEVVELKKKIGFLSGQENTTENREKLKQYKKDLFLKQFVPHIVNIQIKKFKHYDLLNKGFKITIYDEHTGEIISDVSYKRLLSTSASIKKNEVFYINEEYREQIMNNLECGYNK